MKLLAIDTATDACSAAILAGDELIDRHVLAPRAHARLILPMIAELLAETDLRLGDLDAIGFGRGPGSFTGVRIAAGVTQGLALGADLPVVPISDLAVLAQGAMRCRGWPAVLAALDARMGEVYWGAFRRGDDGAAQAAGDETVIAPRVATAPAGDWRGAGPGWAAHGAALSSALGFAPEFDADWLPHAVDVARLAEREVRRGAALAPERALPVYLRDSVADTYPTRPGGRRSRA
ncbi:tRNA (adenosine(37)-N6)-threonylcarbamoyltransferase complex dimerization subunit type 1 TsaB [soil metagenome]